MNTSLSSMTRLLGGALALSTLFLVPSAHAADGAGNASAEVIAPIAIVEATALDFGTFGPATSAGTVSIDAAGARTQTGGISLFPGDAGTAAAFNVTGEGTSTYAITLPTSENLTGPGTAMVMDTWVSSPSATGTLTAGAQTLNVGATLNVNANQTAGSYAGTYTVTVEYN